MWNANARGPATLESERSAQTTTLSEDKAAAKDKWKEWEEKQWKETELVVLPSRCKSEQDN